MVKAVIMAGGYGTRLRPLTCNRTKPMIPVINRPVLEHVINLLKRHGITDIIITLYSHPENIQNYFGDGSDWAVNITYSVEETPLGTAGGVKKAIKDQNETFIVLSGDGVIDFDITKIIEYHRDKKSLFTIVLKRVKEPTEFGIVITNEDGKIEKFLEKPTGSEVITDTVNTGMYIIEPEIMRDHVQTDQTMDFSLDLFPLLQSKNIPLLGYITDGYWRDIGNIESYRNAQHEILDGLVQIDFPGKKIGNNIWVGKDVDIASDAKIKGPVLLGDSVRIKARAEVSDLSVIGDNCIIEEEASVRRSIILKSTVVGPKSEIRGAIIGKRCVIEDEVSINEGAVLSDDCQVGRSAEIPSGIRVWPDKVIEQDVRLTTDLIWGQTEKKTLFSSDGISGSFNIKITPEFAAKIGATIGAYIGKQSKVVISRDTTSASILIKDAIKAGLLSMGVDVYDLEMESIPINRYSTRFINAKIGMYIQKSPLASLQYILIKIFNQHGFQLPASDEKKIENIFFRGDYPRKDAFEVGKIVYQIHHIESYISNTKKYLSSDILQKKSMNIILDCFSGTASNVFPNLLSHHGCSVTVLRGQMKEFASENELKRVTRKSILNIVNMAKANREIGAVIGPHGEYITIIDELGNILSRDDVIAILCIYYLKYRDEKIINIPVTSSKVIDKIVYSYGGKVKRISSKIRSPENKEDIFIHDTLGRYPYLEHDYDPMITFLTILECIALENVFLYELRERLPKSNLRRESIPCTNEEKAVILRIITTNEDMDKMEIIDGVRIIKDDSWILILPDATQPLLHFMVEGDSIQSRDRLFDEYVGKIMKYKNMP